jgi:hypothetical protein
LEKINKKQFSHLHLDSAGIGEGLQNDYGMVGNNWEGIWIGYFNPFNVKKELYFVRKIPTIEGLL